MSGRALLVVPLLPSTAAADLISCFLALAAARGAACTRSPT